MPFEIGVKFVIGTGAWLDSAMADWSEAAPDMPLHRVDVGQGSDYRFDLSALPDTPGEGATAFVAWGPQFLNFRRLELMSELKSRGFGMPPLICRTAIISQTASVGENSSIGAGALIASNGRVGFNCRVGAGCRVGHASQIGNSVWLADGAQIGIKVRVGAHATIGSGVIVDDDLDIGKQSILDLPGRRSTSLAPKTFLMLPFAREVIIVDGGPL
jgi:hypothetical protein